MSAGDHHHVGLKTWEKAGRQLAAAWPHGVSEALYLGDHDGTGMELYWDRPREL